MAPVDKENAGPNAGRDMLWIPVRSFDIVKSKLASGTSIHPDEVNELVNPNLKDDDMCIPVDMNGAGENLDDFEAALARLGPKTAAECFIRALEHFEKTKSTIPAADCPKPITAKEYKKMYYDEDDEEDVTQQYMPDIFHVPKALFESTRGKLSKGQALEKVDVDGLVNWEPVDSEVYIPVDMHATDEDLDDFDDALAKLGPMTIAKCFVQAFERFEKKKHLLPEDKQKSLTGKEYKELYPDDGQEDGEEEQGDFNEDEEEDEDHSDAEAEEEDDTEPPSKKAKVV